jgi:hypothetical protein
MRFLEIKSIARVHQPTMWQYGRSRFMERFASRSGVDEEGVCAYIKWGMCTEIEDTMGGQVEGVIA